MDELEYVQKALGIARDRAIQNPTYSFAPSDLAAFIEDLNNTDGASKTHAALAKQLKILTGQGILSHIGPHTKRVGKVLYSDEEYAFKNLNHPTLLRILNIKSNQTLLNSTQQSEQPKKVSIQNIKSFETAFGNYTVTNFIEGGVGVVFHVQDEDKNIFAIKCLKPEHVDTRKAKRFKNEIYFGQNNKHPGIVNILDIGYIKINECKCPFFIMPLFPATFRDLIDSNFSHESKLSFYIQLLEAVQYAHSQDVFHRDIKPENILWNSKDKIALADFGIAHFNEERLYTSIETKGERLANFPYAAPEQRIRGGKVSHRTDIFSLGLILNEIFTKKIPGGTGFALIRNFASPFGYLDEIVDRMIRQSPEERYGSISEVLSEIKVRSQLAQGNDKLIKMQQALQFQGADITDPIYLNPIQIVPPLNYSDSFLIYRLNQDINEKWGSIFKDVSNETRALEMSGHWYEIHGGQLIRYQLLQGQNAQKITDDLKMFIEQTNKQYRLIVENETKEIVQLEEAEIRRQIDEETQRQTILKSIRI